MGTPTGTASGTRDRRAELAERFGRVRAATAALCAPLSPEDAVVQSMPDASPAKWHLAHTTWFFETFVLSAARPQRRPFHPAYSYLFNSYYENVGARHARPERGLLTRPSLDEVHGYRRAIERELADWLAAPPRAADAALLDVLELGLAHEEQHQELIVTDLKHLLSRNPLEPAYWRRGDGGAWSLFTLAGRRALCADEPLAHVSYYEADAYARFRGARLPRECEWEVAAREHAPQGHFAESGALHPRAAAERADGAPAALYGDVWEWTQSPYVAYPGYRPAEGALGEYNGKFMANQLVLRGGSCATPPGHVRATYRNFFPPTARWQFSGLRLARDA